MDYIEQLFDEMYANQYNKKHLLGMLNYLEERPYDFDNYIHNALLATVKWYIENENSDDIKKQLDKL